MLTNYLKALHNTISKLAIDGDAKWDVNTLTYDLKALDKDLIALVLAHMKWYNRYKALLMILGIRGSGVKGKIGERRGE